MNRSNRTVLKGDSCESIRVVARALMLTAIASVFPYASGMAAESLPRAVDMIDLPARPVMLPKVECGSLAHRDFTGIPGAPTSIFSADIETARGESGEFCLIKGYVSPQVQFELRLPTKTYTGRYLQGGCGGACGSISNDVAPACDTRVARGGAFALGFNDSGHVGASAMDTVWAAGDPAARIDFAHRAAHVTALAAKALISVFYGAPPQFSYFQGCSNGGREGLMEARLHPDDFSGIVAGAPAIWITPGVERIIWESRLAAGTDREPALTAAAVALLHRAVMNACDRLDGLKDGQIDDPRVCHYDPRQLICRAGEVPPVCVTRQQAEVMRQLYQGPVDGQGRHLYPGGEPYGSELTWVNPGALTRIAASLANNQIKYMIYGGDYPRDFDWKTWKFDQQELSALLSHGGYYDASSTNLERFRQEGGKLLLWQGAADSAAGPYVLFDYYQRIRDRVGGLAAAREFARLFLVPGVYHCGGGYVAYEEDFLGAMVAWVERGTPPDSVIASGVQTDGALRRRPIFAYPVSARYRGGSIDNAASFQPVAPKAEPDDHYAWLGADMAERDTTQDLQLEQIVTGDLTRRYVLPETGETSKYRLYVPATYDASMPYGLVLILHGYGENQDDPFDRAPEGLRGIIQREASKHQFLVVAPAGHGGRGDYGAHLRLPNASQLKIDRSDSEDDLAEADVMSVLRRVMRDYRIDGRRVYLMGNSMGMTGTLYLAQKYQGTWCAIAPSDGPPWQDYPVARLGYLAGAYFVNGAKDTLALSEANRRLADRVRTAGVDTAFSEIPNGEHGSAWYFAVPAIFDFFAAHRCRDGSEATAPP